MKVPSDVLATRYVGVSELREFSKAQSNHPNQATWLWNALLFHANTELELLRRPRLDIRSPDGSAEHSPHDVRNRLSQLRISIESLKRAAPFLSEGFTDHFGPKQKELLDTWVVQL